MRDEPIEISQGTLGSLRVAVPSPFPQGGGKGTSFSRLAILLRQPHAERKRFD